MNRRRWLQLSGLAFVPDLPGAAVDPTGHERALVCRPLGEAMAADAWWLAFSGGSEDAATERILTLSRGLPVAVMLHGNRWAVALTAGERSVREAAEYELLGTVRLAGRLGSRLVVTALPPREAMADGLDALRRARTVAEAAGVQLALEGAGAREVALTEGLGWCAAAGEAGGPGCVAAFSTPRLLPGKGAAEVFLPGRLQGESATFS